MKLLIFIPIFVVATCSAGPVTNGTSLAEGLHLYDKWAEDPTKLDATQVKDAVAASSYVQGFLDGSGIWQMLSINVPFSFPKEGVSPAQFIKVAEKYLSDHPESLHRPAGELLYEALVKGFPNPDYIKRTPPSS